MTFFRRVGMLVALLSAMSSIGYGEPAKRLLMLGQKRDHPPGRHEYMPGLRLLEKCLQGVPGLQVKLAAADEPWTEGPSLLQQADGVVLYLGEGAKWLQGSPERLAAMRDLARRGGGIVALHWAIGAKDGRYIDRCLELLGGCHGGDDRRYVVMEGDVQVVDRTHPIAIGIADVRVHDEFYYRLKFAKEGEIRPILRVPIEGNAETVAWTFTRPDGGRSFGFSALDEHRNWGNESYGRLVAQAVLWTLKLPVPGEGLPVKISEEDLALPAEDKPAK